MLGFRRMSIVTSFISFSFILFYYHFFHILSLFKGGDVLISGFKYFLAGAICILCQDRVIAPHMDKGS